jgi:hypothetical protein
MASRIGHSSKYNLLVRTLCCEQRPPHWVSGERRQFEAPAMYRLYLVVGLLSCHSSDAKRRKSALIRKTRDQYSFDATGTIYHAGKAIAKGISEHQHQRGFATTVCLVQNRMVRESHFRRSFLCLSIQHFHQSGQRCDILRTLLRNLVLASAVAVCTRPKAFYLITKLANVGLPYIPCIGRTARECASWTVTSWGASICSVVQVCVALHRLKKK